MDKYVIGCDVSKNKLDVALLLSLEPLKIRSKIVANDQPVADEALCNDSGDEDDWVQHREDSCSCGR